MSIYTDTKKSIQQFNGLELVGEFTPPVYHPTELLDQVGYKKGITKDVHTPTYIALAPSVGDVEMDELNQKMNALRVMFSSGHWYSADGKITGGNTYVLAPRLYCLENPIGRVAAGHIFEVDDPEQNPALQIRRPVPTERLCLDIYIHGYLSERRALDDLQKRNENRSRL